ncbi:MAG: hypothetical protein IPH41_01960 [Sulfuritalea sp.]|jgi:hypothetical protein|nr:hypothetical protein [Sulfuritalea sp.]
MAGEFATGLVSIGVNRGEINRKQRKLDNELRLRADDRAAQQAQLGVMQYLSGQRRMDEQKKAQEEERAARAEQMRAAATQAETARQDSSRATYAADMERQRQANFGLSPQDEAKATGIVKQIVNANDSILKAGKIEQGIGQITKAYDDAAKSGNPAIYKLALAASGLHPNMTRPDDFSVKTEYDPKTREEYMVAYDGSGKQVSRNATGRKSEANQREPFNSQTHQERVGQEMATVLGGKLDQQGRRSVDNTDRYSRLNAIAQGIGRDFGKQFSPGEIAGAVNAAEPKGQPISAAQALRQATAEAEQKAGWLSPDSEDFESNGGSREKFIQTRTAEILAGAGGGNLTDAEIRTAAIRRLGINPPDLRVQPAPQAESLRTKPLSIERDESGRIVSITNGPTTETPATSTRKPTPIESAREAMTGDSAMEGYTLGDQTARGFMVLDANGEHVGYYGQVNSEQSQEQ